MSGKIWMSDIHWKKKIFKIWGAENKKEINATTRKRERLKMITWLIMESRLRWWYEHDPPPPPPPTWTWPRPQTQTHEPLIKSYFFLSLSVQFNQNGDEPLFQSKKRETKTPSYQCPPPLSSTSSLFCFSPKWYDNF